MNFLANLRELFIYDVNNPLIFNSGAFFIFFVIFISIYSIMSKQKWFITLYVIAFSFFFYYKSSGWYLAILVLTSITDFSFGWLLHVSKRKFWRAFWLFMGVIPSLGLLAYFKYTNFLLFNWSLIIENNFQPLDIFLPIGISFYTFQSVSYVIDVYRRKLEPTKNILEYAFFLSFFPQLVAGPIVKAHHFLPQLKKKIKVTKEQVYSGFWLIIIGLIKKAVIADYIAQYNDLIFAAPDTYSGFENLMAIYGYTLQIYCDFSGYSDMAIGLGRIMGFDLGINFNFPYKAKNITDFWRRWHISLSTWLRDYLYIPLGGNRSTSFFSIMSIPLILFLIIIMQGWDVYNVIYFVSITVIGILAFKLPNIRLLTYLTLSAILALIIVWLPDNWMASAYLSVILVLWIIYVLKPSAGNHISTGINSMLTMLIGGLWHGANWKFVFWGGLHGIGLAVHKFWSSLFKNFKGNWFTRITGGTISWFITFHFVIFLWIFFRATDIQKDVPVPATDKIETLTVDGFYVSWWMVDKVINDMDFSFAEHFWDARYVWVILMIVGILMHAAPLKWTNKVSEWFVKSPYIVKILVFVIVVQLVIQFKNQDVQPFIYFQF